MYRNYIKIDHTELLTAKREPAIMLTVAYGDGFSLLSNRVSVLLTKAEIKVLKTAIRNLEILETK